MALATRVHNGKKYAAGTRIECHGKLGRIYSFDTFRKKPEWIYAHMDDGSEEELSTHISWNVVDEETAPESWKFHFKEFYERGHYGVYLSPTGKAHLAEVFIGEVHGKSARRRPAVTFKACVVFYGDGETETRTEEIGKGSRPECAALLLTRWMTNRSDACYGRTLHE